MIHGLFLDPRAWAIDFLQSSFWNTEQHGVMIDMHPDAFNIHKTGISNKYKFVIATEVWEIPMRKTLNYLRKQGVKVFLAPREPFKTDILKDAMFSYDRFLWNGEYYFTPDVVLAPGQAYADLWQDKTKTYLTGYPRFDYYIDHSKWLSEQEIIGRYGLDLSKKRVFFPSYPPYHYKKEDGTDTMIDLYEDRDNTIRALDSIVKKNGWQAVVKVHPASMKAFLKKTGNGNEVSQFMLSRNKSPVPHMRMIMDDRNNNQRSKELLINCDIVCGFTSTMLLEAEIMKKPAIHLLFGKTKDLVGIPEYAQHLPVAYNSEELEGLLKTVTYKPNPMVKKYLYKIDGQSCKRICEAIRREL